MTLGPSRLATAHHAAVGVPTRTRAARQVRALLDRGLTYDQLRYYGLEFRYVSEHLRNDIIRTEMFDALNNAIHRFAKRQDTWFRRMERQGIHIDWLDGQDSPEVNVKKMSRPDHQGNE